MRSSLLAVAITVLLTSCSASSPGSSPSPPPSPSPSSTGEHVEIHKVPPFPTGGRLDYQIGGAYDSWTRSRGALARADNVAFATLLARRAHLHGLLIAQKNTSELGHDGRDTIGFDFAVAEECQLYDECDAYTDVYDDRVVEIEYTDNPRSVFTKACRVRGSTISVVLRDRDVVPRGRPGYVDEAC